MTDPKPPRPQFRWCGHQWPSLERSQPHICIKTPNHQRERCVCACGKTETAWVGVLP